LLIPTVPIPFLSRPRTERTSAVEKKSLHFLFCLQNSKKSIFDIIILLTNVFGDIRRSIKSLKTILEGMGKNCGTKSILVAYAG
jgi:hypothetical protein